MGASSSSSRLLLLQLNLAAVTPRWNEAVISFSCHYNSSHNWEDYCVQASYRDDVGELLDDHVERKHVFLDGSCKDLDSRNVVDVNASAADRSGVALWLSYGVILY